MQNSAQPPSPYAADEISLIELWQILARRKALILLGFVVCVAAGAAYVFLKAPVYQASVKVRVGQVNGESGLLEDAEALSSRLMARYGEEVADGIKRDRPFLTRVAAQKNLTSAIELVVEGDTPNQAAGLLRQVVEGIQQEHVAIYQENVKLITERLQNLDGQRAALQKQYEDATTLMEQLKQRDTIQASLVMLERGRITTSISELDAEKPMLAQRLAAPQTRPTALLSEITAPRKPSKPKKSLVLALAAVLGLMGGVMLAFLAEFVAKAKPAMIAKQTTTTTRL